MNQATKIGLVATAAAIALAGTALAGTKTYPQVTVNTTTRSASGAVSTARNTSGTQYIGCTVTGSTFSVTCQARTASGTVGSCQATGYSRALTTASVINADSYIQFKWDASNNCTYLKVQNSSEYEPKVW